MATITNVARAIGMLAGVDYEMNSTATVETRSGITMTKVPSMTYWGDGELTYTITIVNSTADAYTGVTITDQLDFTLVTLVPDSILVNGAVPAPGAVLIDGSGMLTVAAVEVPAGGNYVLSFRVAQVT